MAFKVSSAAAVFLLAIVAGCGGNEPAVTPSEYANWNAKDGTFQLDYPAAWEADGGGRSGVQWARFEKGSAEVYVRINHGQAVLGDVMGGGAGPLMDGGDLLGGGAPDPENEPVAVLHEENRTLSESEYADVDEQEAEVFDCRLGPARLSTFSGKKGRHDIRGIRATVLGRDRAVLVLCHCAESDWEILEPVFRRMLESLARGTSQIG